MNSRISMERFIGIFFKEVYQLRHDYVTLIIMTLIPIVQVLLFSFTFNSDPKNISTVIVSADQSSYVRTLIKGLENTAYFKIVDSFVTEEQAHKLLYQGKIYFIVNIPPNFTYDLVRGNRPTVLLEANASNPLTVNNAINAARELSRTVYNYDSQFINLPQATPGPFVLNVEPRFNPGNISQRFTVTGFMAISLTLLLTFAMANSITREYELNTVERLLMTPVNALELMFAKLTPFLVLGYIQFTILLSIAYFLFNVPMRGDIGLLYLSFLPFAVGHLGVGLFISSLARNQFQALQFTNIYILPNMVFSGFLLPFEGMPLWAQWVGTILPTTHFIRIMLRVNLAGVGLESIWQDLFAMIAFAIVILTLATRTYRSTLD